MGLGCVGLTEVFHPFVPFQVYLEFSLRQHYVLHQTISKWLTTTADSSGVQIPHARGKTAPLFANMTANITAGIQRQFDADPAFQTLQFGNFYGPSNNANLPTAAHNQGGPADISYTDTMAAPAKVSTIIKKFTVERVDLYLKKSVGLGTGTAYWERGLVYFFRQFSVK